MWLKSVKEYVIISKIMCLKGEMNMFIGKVIDRFDRLNNSKAKLSGFLFVLSVVMMMCISVGSRFFTTSWYSVSILGGGFFTALLCACSLRNNKIKVSGFGFFILAMEFIVGCSFILSGLMLHVVAYSMIGLVLAFLMPLAQFAFATYDKKMVTRRVCMAIILSYYIFLVTNLFYGPVMTNFQYKAIMGNGNLVGYFIIIVIPSLLYFLMDDKLSFARKAFVWGTFVSAASLLVFTSSRTSAIAAIASMGLSLTVIISKRDKSKKLAFDKKRIITIIVITVLVPLLMFFMLTSVRRAVIKTVRWVQSLGSSSSSSQKGDLHEDDEGEYSLDYYMKGLDGEGEDSFTSGRILIWKDFIKNVGVKGHTSETREVVEDTRYYPDAHAHNVYLQTAYSAGIVTGLAYLALVAAVGIKAAMWFIAVMRNKKKYTMEMIISCCFVVCFAVVSLTSDGYMVYNYYPTTMFWLMSYMFIFKSKDEEKPEGAE